MIEEHNGLSVNENIFSIIIIFVCIILCYLLLSLFITT